VLEAHGQQQHREVAVLLASETVTNAVLHGKGHVAVRVVCDGGRIRIEVDDASDQPAVVREPGTAATSGRGMGLVARLADRWGNTPGERGKTVWFELAS